MEDDRDEQSTDARSPSRSQKKREAEALKKLGARLVELPPERLRRLPLSEALRTAVEDAQAIRAHGGRRRQLQLIGKLLRHEDAEPIERAVAQLDQQSAEQKRAHHQAENWRTRILQEGDGAVAEFMRQHPDADPQQLRQLMRDARREESAGKPPKSGRALFRALRAAMEAG